MAIWRSICVWSSSGRHFLIYSKHIPCRWILWYVGRTTTRHRRVNHQGRHIPSLSPFDATVRQRWGSGEPLSLFLFSPFVSTTKIILSFVSLHLYGHVSTPNWIWNVSYSICSFWEGLDFDCQHSYNASSSLCPWVYVRRLKRSYYIELNPAVSLTPLAPMAPHSGTQPGCTLAILTR